jgi:hypothetical protein
MCFPKGRVQWGCTPDLTFCASVNSTIGNATENRDEIGWFHESFSQRGWRRVTEWALVAQVELESDSARSEWWNGRAWGAGGFFGVRSRSQWGALDCRSWLMEGGGGRGAYRAEVEAKQTQKQRR